MTISALTSGINLAMKIGEKKNDQTSDGSFAGMLASLGGNTSAATGQNTKIKKQEVA